MDMQAGYIPLFHFDHRVIVVRKVHLRAKLGHREGKVN
jgi:hypothetical protein